MQFYNNRGQITVSVPRFSLIPIHQQLYNQLDNKDQITQQTWSRNVQPASSDYLAPDNPDFS